MSEQPHLEDGVTSLPTSLTSDWRLVLRDSITTADLRAGCISLFDRVNSELKLTSIEVAHAVIFLKYVCFHIKYRRPSNIEFIETIFLNEEHLQSTPTSALIKLVCHPSNTLRTVTLSFIDAFLSFTTPYNIRDYLKTARWPYRYKQVPDIVDPIFQVSSTYLRSLISTPVCPTDPRSGFALLSSMTQFTPIMTGNVSSSHFPEMRNFFGEINKELLEELASILGLGSADEAQRCLFFNPRYPSSTIPWLKGFEVLLGRVREGGKFSDVEFQAVVLFLFCRPQTSELFFLSDGLFELKIWNTRISLSKLDPKLLWALFTPAQPDLAVTVLNLLRWYTMNLDVKTALKHVWNEWFPAFVSVVDPSKLAFTSESIPIHTALIDLMTNHLVNLEDERKHFMCPNLSQHRRALDETYHAFYKQTKAYAVHLSLHPFALDHSLRDRILDFFRDHYFHYSKNPWIIPSRGEVRQAMNTSAVTSSSPPFILTTDLVCPLTNAEILTIVDRIVTLLDSDSFVDDDTILRILAFHKHQLHRIYLPELFRTCGRTSGQYLHAFESLISLPIDFFERAPINYLLSTRPDHLRPTLDEWDDVDLETVGILKRMIDRNNHSLNFVSDRLSELILRFVIKCFPQIVNCATRLSQSQFEHLLAPSLAILSEYFIQPRHNDYTAQMRFGTLFHDVCQSCEQRVIAQCLSRTGFFSRIVTALFNPNFDTCADFFQHVISHRRYIGFWKDDQTHVRRTIPSFLEEGWQDALEFIFVQGKDVNSHNAQKRTRDMIVYFGANLNWKNGSDGIL
ncbi:hypothetical protein BLNAU_21354 [Blattamonas nauphoetae]|uniref:Uncharacterized protein n=1 Tax=Blattamonas nauphoetae TaxID=2049346 RepID=A0ABQ9WW32_9EUKA|nr:hypothetical protein BLNAU_21354 [Blattamonas nauphoetae]